MKDSTNKEKIFTKKIEPVLDQLLKLCDQHDIPMVVGFGLGSDEKSHFIHTAGVFLKEGNPEVLIMVSKLLESPNLAVLFTLAVRKAQASKNQPEKKIQVARF